MLILILSLLGLIFITSAMSLLLLQQYKISNGSIVVDPEHNGPKDVSITVRTVIRFLLKQSVHMRKFFTQYVFHVLVRFMYHFDIFTTKMYAKSRNWFVKNAVKNKGTVPHFWDHLKVYKQEMDQEREDEEAVK